MVRARQVSLCVAQLVRAVHRNRRTAGSIPARGPIVTFFAAACPWFGLINEKNSTQNFHLCLFTTEPANE